MPRRAVVPDLFALLSLVASFLPGPSSVAPVSANHTPAPTSVTVAGSFESEVGCPGDWQPACATTHLNYDTNDDVWQGSWAIPAGSYEYKAALNDRWDENYGLHAAQNGANSPLSFASPTSVKFYYDHKSHWVTDNQSSVIATVPGSFQSELGCSGDWDPGCLRSWLEDPDGDGIYRFATTALPVGSYEAKVAINEGWTENYGQGGVLNGANIAFTVPRTGAPVTFRYDPASHILSVSAGHDHDNNVEYFGLGHNSRDALYRVPFGAITPGTALTLRFRTYHTDVTGVRVRFYDTVGSHEVFQDMTLAAGEVSCYDPSQPNERCDLWQTVYTPPQTTTLYYRFIITDGTATAYYADDAFKDGGWGQATPTPVDNSYAVTVYSPDFTPIAWMRDAVVYQIFPDRFRNGNPGNDPGPSEPRYGYPPTPEDQIVRKGWDDLPEGFCRSYDDPAQPCDEQPRGRDFFGGDLQGVTARLDFLQALGVTAIYFNPIFEAASNHLYDTRDYTEIAHFLGSQEDWQRLVSAADARGIKIILDGVFNHVSSDSPSFDRYGHFAIVGACENPGSPFRSWFFFHDVAPGTGPCVASNGTPNAATYDAWLGFDSLAVLNKNNPAVRALIYSAPDAVARLWLDRGASGWRLDVMGDLSFPDDFWQGFRSAVKATDPEAPIIGELWKKQEVLPKIHGNQADTAMNYRFRNAILGFFGRVDDKGFADDGQSDQPPSLFASKLLSTREDYPDATYYTLLNLLDSHDTERILWSLTPGKENREEKEFNAGNVAAGKARLRLAALVQMTIPGAPTIYSGDEVGVTGDDDPDDRRTLPWLDQSASTLYLPIVASNAGPGSPGPVAAQAGEDYGVGGDRSLLEYYRRLTGLRHSREVFRSGELTFLLTDDAGRTLAYLMRTRNDAALVAINRNSIQQTLTISVTGRLPDIVRFTDALSGQTGIAASAGILTLTLPALGAAVLLPVAGQDLTPPAASANLSATAASGQVALSWSGIGDAARYKVYRSPVTGGGYEAIATTATTAYTDTSTVSGQRAYYVVRAVDAAGNEGAAANEATALPSALVG
ncbi:MAG TPA: alpha-amylase, partial [Chloroflexi bacterium]|nr:alpha-amylase [Chloroflexota bacterium]